MRFSSFLLVAINFIVHASGGASAAFITNLPSLNANDAISWSQLGAPGSSIPSSFTAASANGFTVTGNFLGAAGGTVGKVCPAPNCNWAAAPGFNGGDSLVWTEDASGNGTGFLTITFGNPVRGVGFYLELTAPGTFVANFAATTSTGISYEFPRSDSSGNPLFIGVLDPTADITGVTIAMSSCTPSSPGACNTADFAIDSMYLATTVPEPGSFGFVCAAALLTVCCRRRLFRKMPGRQAVIALSISCAAMLLLIVKPALAQDPGPIEPGEATLIHAPQSGQITSSLDSTLAAAVLQPDPATPALPVWSYSIASPLNGFFYRGYMVGTSAFNRGARTTVIPAILVPFIVKFTNTTSGFTTTFDPSTAPDAACTAGQTAMSLVENSPIFQNYPWTLNGADLGNTQYIDAFQRANFWQYVQNTGNAYHTLLSYTVGEPLTLSLSYPAPTLAAEVRTGVQSSCTNPGGSGSVNGAAYQGIVDFDVMRNAMADYIASHGITPDQFPIFILYNVEYSQNQLLYLGGYHFSELPSPGSPTPVGQTFAVANFRTNGTGPLDVSILSHEIAEWMDDPGGFNGVPAWGNVGEVTGCRFDLEVGDPLTLTDLPPIAGPNGFSYHLQELAFFSWFFRTPSIGAGALFSDKGTLAADGGAVCQ